MSRVRSPSPAPIFQEIWFASGDSVSSMRAASRSITRSGAAQMEICRATTPTQRLINLCDLLCGQYVYARMGRGAPGRRDVADDRGQRGIMTIRSRLVSLAVMSLVIVLASSTPTTAQKDAAQPIRVRISQPVLKALIVR